MRPAAWDGSVDRLDDKVQASTRFNPALNHRSSIGQNGILRWRDEIDWKAELQTGVGELADGMNIEISPSHQALPSSIARVISTPNSYIVSQNAPRCGSCASPS